MQLSNSEKIQHRLWLEGPNKPAKVVSYIDDIANAMQGESPLNVDFFTQPGIEFLRDAWVSAKFALATNADTITLVAESERYPDVRIFYGQEIEEWEITEAQCPGRRRGAEEKEAENRRKEGKPYACNKSASSATARTNSIPHALRTAIKIKKAKIYGNSARLLIYLNIDVGYLNIDVGVGDTRDIRIGGKNAETAMADATKSGKDSFARISVLFKDCVYHLWQDGKRGRGLVSAGR